MEGINKEVFVAEGREERIHYSKSYVIKSRSVHDWNQWKKRDLRLRPKKILDNQIITTFQPRSVFTTLL